MAGMGGRGGPDLPGGVPAQMEWLFLSSARDDGKPFMRVLPVGAQRNDIVAAVLVLLVLLIILLSLLLHPIIAIPAGFLVGGWLFRKGLHGLRDGLAVANTPAARTSSAALGLVDLAGRAVTAQPSIAPVTGRPSV